MPKHEFEKLKSDIDPNELPLTCYFDTVVVNKITRVRMCATILQQSSLYTSSVADQQANVQGESCKNIAERGSIVNVAT